MPVATFKNCRCPACRARLDDVAAEAGHCPRCNGALEPDAVWATRRYPGLLTLPGGVRAFGWPLALMAGGALLMLGSLAVSDGDAVWIHGPATIIGTGFVWFVVKFFNMDD
jgi:hypothetical protein